MATSEADICNKALAKIGIRGAFVADMRNDDSEEAEVCAVLYDDLRDACLAAFPWPFATLRRVLARIDAAVEPARDGWAFVYAMPTGCLQPRKMWPAGQGERSLRSDQRIPFAIEKALAGDDQVILCDLETPVLFYTARVEDVTKFTPLFVDAFAYLLGAEIAPSLTSKASIEQSARQRYFLKISEAQAASLNSQQEDVAPEPEALAARL